MNVALATRDAASTALDAATLTLPLRRIVVAAVLAAALPLLLQLPAMVSTGIGADAPPLRLWCPPELVVVDLMGSARH